MKKKLLLLLGLLPLTVQAQDTAEAVVDRYVSLLNYDALPKDSMLVMETTIIYRDQADTFYMRRYYQEGEMHRIEVYHGDSLTTGLCSNGTFRFREYSAATEWWDDREPDQWRSLMEPYDFRGPLYRWRERGIKLTYMGTSQVGGHDMLTVRTEQIDHYVRLYFFDPSNGLLVLIMERDEMPEGSHSSPFRTRNIDFKFVHEFMPMGESLVPSQESYRRGVDMVIMLTTMRFEPRNNLLFNQD